MPSTEHELPLELVRNQPRLIPELLRTVFGFDLPADVQATLGSETYAGFHPPERRCDGTVLIGDLTKPRLGVIVESQVQLGEIKTDKIFKWPAYLADLRARRKCAVALMVLCQNEKLAKACAKPIRLGPCGSMIYPLAVSPQRLPPVTDPHLARSLPELAVLSAPAHAEGPHAEAVLKSICTAFAAVDADLGELYHDYVASRLSVAARKLLEEILAIDLKNYQWQSEFALSHIAKGKAEGRVEGRAEGEARSILLFLAARDIPVPDQVRDRITGCTDLDQLETWVRRAAIVDHAERLFDQ